MTTVVAAIGAIAAIIGIAIAFIVLPIATFIVSATIADYKSKRGESVKWAYYSIAIGLAPALILSVIAGIMFG